MRESLTRKSTDSEGQEYDDFSSAAAAVDYIDQKLRETAPAIYRGPHYHVGAPLFHISISGEVRTYKTVTAKPLCDWIVRDVSL